MVFSVVIGALGILLTCFFAFSSKLSKSEGWQATIIPLASIMGSGFLVSAPLLAGVVGLYAVISMAGLLILAYFVGSAVRFNIEWFEPIEANKGIAQDFAFLSKMVVAGAYFVSITYYLQLLAAFSLRIANNENEHLANIITTALLLLIGVIGIWKGLALLSKVEKYAVSINLGMVGALLIAMLVYNIKLATSGTWHFPDVDSTINIKDIRVLLGLLIVVQGFETSRFLGSKYSKARRISSMKTAQILSSIIYIIFISLATVMFHNDLKADVTAIIAMVKPIAWILPILLSFAAIVSQFSAAVADTAGAGGLVQTLTKHKLPVRYIYLIILLITVFLTWETDVNQIIAYASRAFALFYALQCVVAFLVAKSNTQVNGRRFKMIKFLMLSIMCLSVFLFGIPSE